MLLTLEGMLAQDRERVSRLVGAPMLKAAEPKIRRSRTLSRLDTLSALGELI